MARRSLRPQLNQIRAWVRQGRTDAWIAHQLEVTVQQIQAFKREQGLEAGADVVEGGAPVSEFDDEIDLRAEDDALIAAELEAAAAAREAAAAEETDDDESDESAEGDDDDRPARRRRGRRGGARTGSGRPRRKTTAGTLEGTFDHGDEGYGLWLDPAVQDDPVYAEYWAGHRPIEITIEEEQIVIRRAGGDEEA
ncbi:MAG: hypothetical protein M3071_10435 [Actinomycetota bacterium]|nr:hypothetical protein [Actinomycetota bacterium]